MNPLDVGILVVVALWAAFGFALGFVRGVLFIVAVLAALATTRYTFNFVYGLVQASVDNPLLSALVATGGTFIVSLIIFVIITGRIAKLVRTGGLSGIDRLVGFLFGAVCACGFLSGLFLVVDMSMPRSDWPEWLKTSKSVPFLSEGASMLRGFLPEAVRAKAASAIDDAKPLIDQATQTQRAIRALSNPTARTPAAPDQQLPKTYSPTERREINRLYGTQQ